MQVTGNFQPPPVRFMPRQAAAGRLEPSAAHSLQYGKILSSVWKQENSITCDLYSDRPLLSLSLLNCRSYLLSPFPPSYTTFVFTFTLESLRQTFVRSHTADCAMPPRTKRVAAPNISAPSPFRIHYIDIHSFSAVHMQPTLIITDVLHPYNNCR